MNLSTTILGATAVKQLQATSSAFVLEVGSDRFTRRQLSSVSCFNFLAARNLTRVLQQLEVKHLADLYARIPPTALALPYMGAISLAVLGAAFEVKGIGGDNPLESWVRKHARGENGVAAEMVSFATLKQRELAEVSTEKRATTRRKRARRDQAHHLRVERFTGRQQASAATH